MIWVWRVGAILLIIITAASLLLVLTGVLVGEITEIHKYGQGVVIRSSNPIKFWVSVSYHAVVACFLAYISYFLSRNAGWIRRREKLERFADRIGSTLDPQRNASPWVIAVVLGGFFIFLYYMAVR